MQRGRRAKVEATFEAQVATRQTAQLQQELRSIDVGRGAKIAVAAANRLDKATAHSGFKWSREENNVLIEAYAVGVCAVYVYSSVIRKSFDKPNTGEMSCREKARVTKIYTLAQ